MKTAQELVRPARVVRFEKKPVFVPALLIGVLGILIMLLSGCGTPGYIRADAIDGTLRDLIERHDGYVAADTGLSELESRVYKRDGELLIKVLDEAQKPQE